MHRVLAGIWQNKQKEHGHIVKHTIESQEQYEEK